MTEERAGAGRRPLAVALSYEPGEDAAPRVVATGKGSVAERIVALARDNGIPIEENAELAQVLGSVELDAQIPLEAFEAVARIIAYLYRANSALPADAGCPAPGTGP